MARLGAPRWVERAQAGLDAFLYGLGVYAVPVAIGVVTLIALLSWRAQYPVAGAMPVGFSVLEEHGAKLDPAQALEKLRNLPAVQHRDTKLSEAPFWFAFSVSPSEDGEPVDVELPSRHSIEATCWDATSLRKLGSANRLESLGRMKEVKAGFELELGRISSATRILCRSTFSGPGRISVVQWPQSQLSVSSERFNRDAGLLEGGLAMLSAFVLLTALINRQWMYVLFAAWLMASLRLGALSAGWDVHWFDRAVPLGWIFPLRKLTEALFYTLTIVLFSRLFAEELKRVGHSLLLRVVQWSCPPLPTCATRPSSCSMPPT